MQNESFTLRATYKGLINQIRGRYQRREAHEIIMHYEHAQTIDSDKGQSHHDPKVDYTYTGECFYAEITVPYESFLEKALKTPTFVHITVSQYNTTPQQSAQFKVLEDKLRKNFAKFLQ